MKPSEILRGAADLLSDPARYTKHVSARDAAGQPVPPLDERAVRWCGLGAVERVLGEPLGLLTEELLNYGRLGLGELNERRGWGVSTISSPGTPRPLLLVGETNDGPDGRRRIVAGFRRGAELAEEEGR